jgi:protein-serine/threonine kinase
MQTSCGSPCYAAPELVISEGLYVGSAVDIWSCGVILYAMLAGYLPFDDDPANPDGDNINLLYKYIVNTPLSFPDYISTEARDILGLMLVPDPTRRASLEDVMNHPWLAAYAVPRDGLAAPPGTAIAFGKSVDQLERAAMEQHQQKRLAYQRQMRAAAAAIPNAPAPLTSSVVGRSQSHQIDAFAGTARSGGTGRSRSTQPEYLYDSSVDQSYASSAAGPTPPAPAGHRRTHGSPAALGLDDDDPFAAPGSVSNTNKITTSVPATATSNTSSVTAAPNSSKTLGVESAQSPKSGGGHKSAGSGGFRHTIQVEYDDSSSPKGGRKSEDREREREKRGKERSGPQPQHQTPQSVNTAPQVAPVQVNGTPLKERKASQGSMKPLPPSPGPITSTSTTSPYRSPPSSAPATGTTPSKSSTTRSINSPTPTKLNPQRPPPPITPTRATPTVNINPASPPDTPNTPITFAALPAGDDRDKDTASRESSFKGHRKGRSSLDKIVGLGKIFGSGGSGASDAGVGGQSLNGRVPSDGGTSGGSRNGSKNGSTVVLSASSGSEKEKEKDEKDKEKEKEPKEGRKNRRNTLTVMVEPLSRTIRGRGTKGRNATTPTASADPTSAVDGRAKGLFRGQPQSAVVPSTNVSVAAGRGVKSAVGPTPSYAGATGEMGESPGGVGLQASTSKARKVMQWFRTKSKVREGMPGAEDEDDKEGEQMRSVTPTQAEYRKGNAASSSTLHDTSNSHPAPLVQVVVTTPSTSTPTTSRALPSYFPSKSAAPGPPQRSASNATDSLFMTPSLVTRFRNSVTVGGGGAHHSNSAKAHPWSAIRIHHGAVDQTTITTKPPPEVFKHVREVLEGMGVEIQMESEYKYRCVRPKKRKGSMVVGSTAGAVGGVGSASAGSGAGLAAITIVGSAASNGVSYFLV